MLGPRFSLAHAVWMTEAEIEVLAETGAAVSHNPAPTSAAGRRRAGQGAWWRRGVTVGLGLDARGLDDDDDIFREMRVAMSLQRGPIIGTPKPVSSPGARPGDLRRRAADRQGDEPRAAGSGLRRRPGPGGHGRLAWPWVAPEADPRDLLVLRAQAQDVQTVLIDGEVVLRDGLPTGFDLEAVGREVAERMAATPFPTEAAARRPREHVAAFYGAWDVPELDPYLAYNSRG